MGKSSRRKKKTPHEIGVREGRSESSQDLYGSRLTKKNITVRSGHFKYYLAAFVSLITFLVYLKSLQNEFINWDDTEYVVNNPYIHSFNLPFFKWVFFDFYVANWHPLTWLSHALDYAAWGLNPLGHHLTNNILHALCTFIVVLLVIRLMTVYKRVAGNHVASQPFLSARTIGITGAVTGLLFGLHPLHVESVAWVAERKDLLCAIFYLLSITTYTHYVSEVSEKAFVGSASRFFNKTFFFTLGCFLLALLSKPMAVTLPFVLLILDWYPFRRIQSLKTFWAAFIEKLPFLALTLISSIITVMAQRAGGAMEEMKSVSLPARLLVAVKSLIAYLWKMTLPSNLTPFYPYQGNISISSIEYIMAIILTVGITVTCLAVLRQQKLWISLWSYYVITLTPVLGIVQVGSQTMADRYTYLPSLGPFLLIGLIAAKSYEGMTALKGWKVIIRITSLFFVLVMFVSISYATIKQIGIWKNSFVFWDYVLAKEPVRIPFAYISLGEAYRSKGQVDMAIAQYQTALRLKPDYAEAYLNLGEAYKSKGQFDMAIAQYQTALRFKPNFAEAYYNLGIAYKSKGQFDMAIAQYQTALRLKPNFIEAYYNLGIAYNSKGQFDMAIAQYQTALRLKPNFAEAHFNLGLIYLNKGSKDMARIEFELGLKIRPDDYRAQQVLNSIITK